MIIEIEKDRLPECLAVLQSSYEASAVAFGMTEENCPYRGRTRLPLAKLEEEYTHGCSMYGFLRKGRLAGFLSLSASGGILCIQDIAVLPSFQNQGIGNALMRFALEKAKTLHCNTVRLGMVDDNARLKAWYERFGFRTVALKEYAAVSYKVGTMELSL